MYKSVVINIIWRFLKDISSCTYWQLHSFCQQTWEETYNIHIIFLVFIHLSRKKIKQSGRQVCPICKNLCRKEAINLLISWKRLTRFCKLEIARFPLVCSETWFCLVRRLHTEQLTIDSKKEFVEEFPGSTV